MNKKEKFDKLKILLLNHATYVKFYIDALLTNHYDSIIVLDMLLFEILISKFMEYIKCKNY